MRADASLNFAWPHVRTDAGGNGSGWSHDSGAASLELGWYFTDHLKAIVEVGTRSEFQAHGWQPVVIDGREFQGWWTDTFKIRRFSAAAQYQFGRNRWVHPFLTAGVDVADEHRSRTEMPVYAFDSRQANLIRAAITRPDSSRLTTHALVGGGAKTYVSPRVFLLSDIRFMFGRTPEATVLRAGVGVDF